MAVPPVWKESQFFEKMSGYNLFWIVVYQEFDIRLSQNILTFKSLEKTDLDQKVVNSGRTS